MCSFYHLGRSQLGDGQPTVHNRGRRFTLLDVHCEVRARREAGGSAASPSTVVKGQRVGREARKGVARVEGKAGACVRKNMQEGQCWAM